LRQQDTAQAELFKPEPGDGYRPLIVHKPRRGRRVMSKRHVGLQAAAAALELGRPCELATAPASGRQESKP
jgi:hypothetical protein